MATPMVGPTKRRHRWLPLKGLRGWLLSFLQVEAFLCPCGARLEVRREGRVYIDPVSKTPLWMARTIVMPACTRGGAK